MYHENFLEWVWCLRERVFCTWEHTIEHYWHRSEKLCFEPSQIATVTNCDKSGISAVSICDLSQFVIKAVTAQTESNNTENVFCVFGRVPMFTFDMNMKGCNFAHFGVISLVYMFLCIPDTILINDVPRKTPWNGPISMWTCFLYLGVHHRALLTLIWAVVFWTVTNCDSHKLRQIRNPCRRNLWFVAICDQGRDGTNWVQ